MCNYGSGYKSNPVKMIKNVREAITKIEEDPRMFLMISPPGSMLDESEVPATARKGIFNLVKKLSFQNFSFETRAETVSGKKIKEILSVINHKKLSVELGLESSNFWVRKFSINKALSLSDYKKALEILKKNKIRSLTNVIIGSPFLSPSQQIKDTVKTIKWCLKNGNDRCIVFPVHIRKGTLVEKLWDLGIYNPPSLWSLVEVIKKTGKELSKKITISWYKVYQEKGRNALDPKKNLGIFSSPTTCSQCEKNIILLLDKFRETGDFSIIKNLSVFDCKCRREWKKSMASSNDYKKNAIVAYKNLSEKFMEQGWWNKSGKNIIEDIKNTKYLNPS